VRPDVDKLPLVKLDELTMGEVVKFEQFTGMTVKDVFVITQSDQDMPAAVVMGLAWLTARREDPRSPHAQADFWTSLTYQRFVSEFSKRFEFAVPDAAVEGDVEDPTEAA
jgi:hypothetical protein